MRVRILAVGQHIADWAQEAVRGYLARFLAAGVWI